LLTGFAEVRATLNNGYSYVPVLISKPAGTYLRSVFISGRREMPVTGFVMSPEVHLEFVLGTDPLSLEGDVVDDQGKPVGNAIVIGVPDNEVGELSRTSTDQHGHYVLGGLAPGTYRLYALDSIGMEDSVTREFLEPFSDLGENGKAARKQNTQTVLKLIHVNDAY
jgi:hypothetical protein